MNVAAMMRPLISERKGDKSMSGKSAHSSLDLPKRLNLPYFAYGLLKPTEIAHRQIKYLIKDDSCNACVYGSLWVRDGLPLLKIDKGGRVFGYLMYFNDDKVREAYTCISMFEPKQHYYWKEIELYESKVIANTLVGRCPEKASIHIEVEQWNGRDDPVFTKGLSVVDEMLRNYAQEQFISSPPDSFDWSRLFCLQMTYLFLWTAIERYAALSYGPKLGPMEKVKRFGNDPAFKHALKRSVKRNDKVYDSRDPEAYGILDPLRSTASVQYYYLVRSNMSHRGKGAWKDGEIVRQSLIELYEIFRIILNEQMLS